MLPMATPRRLLIATFDELRRTNGFFSHSLRFITIADGHTLRWGRDSQNRIRLPFQQAAIDMNCPLGTESLRLRFLAAYITTIASKKR